MSTKLRVLMITGHYPDAERPMAVPFIARQVDFLTRAGIDIDLFHFKGKKNIVNYLGAWRRLREHSKGKSYDLVHAQWGHSAALALPKRLPWVITFRGNDLEGIIGKNGKPTLLGKVLRTVSKAMARMADGVIVVSDSLAMNFKRNDYQVIPSGLDLELFRPIPKAEARQALGLDPDKKLILFAASTVENPRKRFSLAQSAVDLINDRFNSELIVATKVPHEMIPLYMNACDSLLLTSVHEGSPNVIKESLACNLPIVSVDVGDVRERIGGIEGCFICEDDSKQTIAANLEKVLEREKRIDGRNAVKNLDERVIARRVIEMYKEVLCSSALQNAVLPAPANPGNTPSIL